MFMIFYYLKTQGCKKFMVDEVFLIFFLTLVLIKLLLKIYLISAEEFPLD